MKILKKSVSAVRFFRSWQRGSTDLPDKTDFELKRGKSVLEEFIYTKISTEEKLATLKKDISRLTFHLNR